MCICWSFFIKLSWFVAVILFCTLYKIEFQCTSLCRLVSLPFWTAYFKGLEKASNNSARNYNTKYNLATTQDFYLAYVIGQTVSLSHTHTHTHSKKAYRLVSIKFRSRVVITSISRCKYCISWIHLTRNMRAIIWTSLVFICTWRNLSTTSRMCHRILRKQIRFVITMLRNRITTLLHALPRTPIFQKNETPKVQNCIITATNRKHNIWNKQTKTINYSRHRPVSSATQQYWSHSSR
jgi:hypothetical protein